MPGDQRPAECARHFVGEDGLACAGLPLDQQGTLEGDGCVDRHQQILGGDIGVGTAEFHAPARRLWRRDGGTMVSGSQPCGPNASSGWKRALYAILSLSAIQ